MSRYINYSGPSIFKNMSFYVNGVLWDYEGDFSDGLPPMFDPTYVDRNQKKLEAIAKIENWYLKYKERHRLWAYEVLTEFMFRPGMPLYNVIKRRFEARQQLLVQ
jgi:hypothetical protein